MSVRKERRCDPRAELHRTWTVSVESDHIGQRQAQILDYSSSGMRLAFNGSSSLKPGDRLAIHYPGTNFSYEATVAWSQEEQNRTIAGACLLEAVRSGRRIR